jgi:uncharacterized protein (DUF3820 family)
MNEESSRMGALEIRAIRERAERAMGFFDDPDNIDLKALAIRVLTEDVRAVTLSLMRANLEIFEMQRNRIVAEHSPAPIDATAMLIAAENYALPFGKFAGLRLKDVPADYFMWLKHSCRIRQKELREALDILPDRKVERIKPNPDFLRAWYRNKDGKED